MRSIKYILFLLFLTPVVWGDSTGITYDSTYFEDVHLNGNPTNDSTNHISSITIHVATFDGYKHTILDFTNLVWDAIGVDRYVDSLICSLYCTYNLGSPTVRAFGVWKNQVELDDCSYYFWDSSADYQWGTAGCENASDAGDYNTSDGSGYDRRSTAFTTFAPNATATWFTHTITDTAWLNDNYIDDRNLIWILQIDHEIAIKWVQFASLEGSTTSQRPKVWIYHSEAPTAAGQVIQVMVN